MNIRTLWYFLSAATSGGISAGARRLGIAQSTLSGAVDTLQVELGDLLFENTPVGLRPTPAAIRLRDYAFWLTTEAEQAFLDLQAANTGPTEPVSIFTYGVPRCSAADWAVVGGAFASVRGGGPRGAFVSSDRTTPESDHGNGVTVRYRLAEPGDEASVRDTWTLLMLQGASEHETAIAWEDLSKLRLIGTPLVKHLLAGLGDANADKIDVTAAHPAGILFSLLDRKDAALLVPSATLPEQFAAAGLRAVRVTGAPVAPVIEVTASVGTTSRERHLAQALVDNLRQALSERHSLPRMRALEARVDLHTIRCFRATMETGNTTRAARECFIVQPALSGQLQKLEKSLSRQLFARSHTGMTPTAAGRRLHTLIEPVLNDHATALERLKEGLGSGRSMARVRLGIVPAANEDSLIAEAAAQAIAAWRDEFTDTPISVAEGYTSVLLRWLRTHLIDLAIVDSTQDQPGLRLLPIFREPMTLVFAPGSEWDIGESSIEGRALVASQLVIPSKRFGLRTLFDQAFAEAGVSMAPSLEVDSLAIALRLVGSGHWATILPPSAVHRQLHTGGLKMRLLVSPHIERRICAALRSQLQLQPETAALLSKLDQAFRMPTSDGPLLLEMEQATTF